LRLSSNFYQTHFDKILYVKGCREAFFITRPSIRQEDEEENEVTAAATVT
jgi:hypothetical protein